MEDKVLKSLISGILLCGILFQAVFVWFSDAKVFFFTGAVDRSRRCRFYGMAHQVQFRRCT